MNSIVTPANKNNSYFIVEASVNGYNFTEIGHVPSNANLSTIKEYNFVHYNVTAIVNYYRIRQVDNNGKYSYSKNDKAFFPGIRNQQYGSFEEPG